MEREQVKTMMTIALGTPSVEGQREVFRLMQAMEDERKETCIHCREVWYAVWYRDGVCHACQEKNLPGRARIAAQERHLASVRFWFLKVPIWIGLVALIAKIAC